MNRLDLLANHIGFFRKRKTPKKKDSITVTDFRSNKKIQIPITNNHIKSSNLKQITFKKKILRTYDPGYMNTIACDSAISYINGNSGILQYRGYPIQVLCKKSSFMEVAFLLIYGELPSPKILQVFEKKIRDKSILHTDILKMMKQFRYDSPPMGIMCSTMAALSTLYPEHNPSRKTDKLYKDRKIRNQCIYRILGKVPTIAATAYRHRMGGESNMPHEDLSYVENFLMMMERVNQKDYRPNPIIAKAVETMFIIYAEHELNCSTAALRHLSSSGADIYTAIAGATGALSGLRHGRNSELVLNMLERIGKKQNIPQFIENVKNKREILYGFGHRIYKHEDPRVPIMKEVLQKVFSITGKEKIVELALQLEQYALKEVYFQDRKIYPNVDFYCGIVYQALKFPKDMFAVLFMIPRVVGWLAHWNEFMQETDQKIVRPRQNYNGYTTRKYVSIEERQETMFMLGSSQTDSLIRNRLAHQAASDDRQ